MRKITVLAALAVACLCCAVSVSPAMAKAPTVPDEVAAWFKQSAPGIVERMSLPSNRSGEQPDDQYFYPFNSKIGQPIPVMVWTDEFLTAANPTTDLLVPRGDWMAPISSQGSGVGVLIADIDNGVWEHMCNDDAMTAAALLAARSKDVVASDGHSGVFIIADNIVRQYGLGNHTAPAFGNIKQLQAALTAEKADYDASVEAAGGQPLVGVSPIDFGRFVLDHPELGNLPDQVGVPNQGNLPAPETASLSPWWIIATVVGAVAIGSGGGLLMWGRPGRRIRRTE